MEAVNVIGREGYCSKSPDGKSNKGILLDVACGRKWFVTDRVASAASCAANYIENLERELSEFSYDKKQLSDQFTKLKDVVGKAQDQLKIYEAAQEEYRVYAEAQIQLWKDKFDISEACCQLKMNTLRSINDLLKNHVFEDNMNAQSNQGQELPQTPVPESKPKARPRSRKRTPKVPEKV